VRVGRFPPSDATLAIRGAPAYLTPMPDPETWLRSTPKGLFCEPGKKKENNKNKTL